MPDFTYARFPPMFLILFVAVVLPGVAFAKETKTCTRNMLLPMGRGQTVIIPLQGPCPPGISTT